MQGSDGSWRSDRHPYFRAGHALTPFVLHALLAAPEELVPRPDGAVERALGFIRGTVGSTGAVGLDGVAVMEYPNYSTALALRCLIAAADPDDRERVERMTRRLASEQCRGDIGFGPDDPVHGAWGFGGPRPVGSPGHIDLSYTRHVLEALRDAGLVEADALLRARAERFLRYLQKHPDDPRPQLPDLVPEQRRRAPFPFDGGFYFSPIVQLSKAGIATEPDSGIRSVRSYATATCEGILALLALGVPLDDARLVAARRWLEKHPRIDRVEGIPADDPNGWSGALLFYHLADRARVFDALHWPGPWRRQVRARLAALERPDGSFSNRENILMKEDEPLLATTLAVIALCHARAGP
ncbi:MAG: hypothetical protein ACE5GW_05475 [Planctomycetota bacterium]